MSVAIQEQPFQILRMLLQAEGEVVTREQLCAALWPKDTFVDLEHGINTAVKKQRQALEEPGIEDYRCAHLSSTVCIYSRIDNRLQRFLPSTRRG